jgi:hypothetical protein
LRALADARRSPFGDAALSVSFHSVNSSLH